MRDRIERTADKSAAKLQRKAGREDGGLDPLLALQRSAGNAAVVALLSGGGPAASSGSSRMQVGSVDDRAEGEADRMADAALHRTPLDASAFASAPAAGFAAQRAPDETIRRFMTREAFVQMTLENTATTKTPPEPTHYSIARLLQQYSAVKAETTPDKWERALALLRQMEAEARSFKCSYKMTNPKPDGKAWSRDEGMKKFVEACIAERARAETARRDEEDRRAAGEDPAARPKGRAGVPTGDLVVGRAIPDAIRDKYQKLFKKATERDEHNATGSAAQLITDRDLLKYAGGKDRKPQPGETLESWFGRCAQYEADLFQAREDARRASGKDEASLKEASRMKALYGNVLG